VSPGTSCAWTHASARKTKTAANTVLFIAVPIIFASVLRSASEKNIFRIDQTKRYRLLKKLLWLAIISHIN
jgi:hypothetical protein